MVKACPGIAWKQSNDPDRFWCYFRNRRQPMHSVGITPPPTPPMYPTVIEKGKQETLKPHKTELKITSTTHTCRTLDESLSLGLTFPSVI